MISLPPETADGQFPASMPNPAGGRDLTSELQRIIQTAESDPGWLDRAARRIADHVRAPSLRIWELSEDQSRLELRVCVGRSVPFAALQDDVPVAEGELGQALRNGSLLSVDCRSNSTPDDVRDWAERSQVATFSALQIGDSQQPCGVLGLFTRERLSEAEVALLQNASQMIGNGWRLSAASTQSPPGADLLSSLVPCLSTAIVTLDVQGRVTHWNAGAESLFGFSEQDVLRKTLPIVPDERRQEFAGVAETGHPLRVHRSRTMCRRADLQLIPVMRTTGPLLDVDGAAIGRIEVYQDDSQRAQMGRCLHVQAQIARILAGCRGVDDGLPLLLAAIGEWLGCAVVEFWSRQVDRAAIGRAAVWARQADLRERLAATEVVLPAEAEDWPARMHRQRQIVFEAASGNAERSIDSPLRPAVAGSSGRLAVPVYRGDVPLGVITCTDESLESPDEQTTQTLRFIADGLAQFLLRLRSEADFSQAAARQRQSQKMDAIGLLAGGVAHDFNNLLTVILAYSEMGLDELDATHPLHELFAEIHGAGERAARMTQQLLAVSRQQPVCAVSCDLNCIAADMQRMLQRLLGGRITLKFDPATDLAPVRADVNQLEQVLLNLVVNARDAMPDGGRITITTQTVERLPEASRGERRARRYARLSVTDTGCGMDEATRSRIFEPFFTTKQAGQGTGMGLSTVFGIVKQAGGMIEVASQPGVGTAVCIDLPEDQSALQTQLVDVPVERSPNGTESILVVERDESVRALIRRLLEVRGYTVCDAADAATALHNADPAVELVLVDAQTPAVDALLDAARQSGWRVVVMSGQSDPPDAIGTGDTGQVLRKPFTSDQLARQIRRALDSDAAAPPAAP